ncbi:unnamed protein product [Linum trigynum]|uniref:Uncharacterized protein n=1 Tax=Linum trigynum TaxID=586398 RepID=A0AAV2E596_9ROSI
MPRQSTLIVSSWTPTSWILPNQLSENTRTVVGTSTVAAVFVVTLQPPLQERLQSSFNEPRYPNFDSSSGFFNSMLTSSIQEKWVVSILPIDTHERRSEEASRNIEIKIKQLHLDITYGIPVRSSVC